MISEPEESDFSQYPFKQTYTNTYERTHKLYPITPNSKHEKYMDGLHKTGITLSGPPYCEFLFPLTTEEQYHHINYASQHMYAYGHQAGVYFCFGPIEWKDQSSKDKTLFNENGKSGRCTKCQDYYCGKFSCGDNSEFCNECEEEEEEEEDSSSDTESVGSESSGNDKCCEDKWCIMMYKHDHSTPDKIMPYHDFYHHDAPTTYGLKIENYKTFTDKEALDLERSLGGISVHHIYEVDMFNGISEKTNPFYSDGIKVKR